MRPLRYSINVTLDGYVGHETSVPEQMLMDVHRHAEEQLQRADALLFGRTTYELMEGGWRPPNAAGLPDWMQSFARTIDAARKYVVSSTRTSVEWSSELVTGDLEQAVRALKEEPGKGILTGGVTLPAALAELGLIDEYLFLVEPLVVGHGPYLLPGLTRPLDLELVDRQDLGSGAVVSTYVPRNR